LSSTESLKDSESIDLFSLSEWVKLVEIKSIFWQHNCWYWRILPEHTHTWKMSLRLLCQISRSHGGKTSIN
jgi:hypothetical protein